MVPVKEAIFVLKVRSFSAVPSISGGSAKYGGPAVISNTPIFPAYQFNILFLMDVS
jgi:hypothetical protein